MSHSMGVAQSKAHVKRIEMDRALNPPKYPSAQLTPREEDVVDCILLAMANKDIARTLGISEKTVKRHIFNICDKCGSSTRLELYRYFAPLENELVHQEETSKLRDQIEEMASAHQVEISQMASHIRLCEDLIVRIKVGNGQLAAA
jgi:LuxR family transcriptional regulator of spore coat protein